MSPSPVPVHRSGWQRREQRLAWLLALPALAALAATAAAPVGWTVWESLHLHDLRMPWLGRPFVGLAHYGAAAADARFREAVTHTLWFAVVTVTLETAVGLALALAMNRLARGVGLVRTAVLLPWAVPTVVAALVWRFMFESPGGVASRGVAALAGSAPTWLADPRAAWVPIVLADAWKTTPVVALLLLAGLQSIDGTLYEAARLDGASRWRQFRHVTLPLLRPALMAALVFRLVDALRVFDVVFVLTGGGPGTATEPIALYTFSTLLRHLRFGYGSALAVILFGTTLVLAVVAGRLVGRLGSREEA